MEFSHDAVKRFDVFMWILHSSHSHFSRFTQFTHIVDYCTYLMFVEFSHFTVHLKKFCYGFFKGKSKYFRFSLCKKSELLERETTKKCTLLTRQFLSLLGLSKGKIVFNYRKLRAI